MRVRATHRATFPLNTRKPVPGGVMTLQYGKHKGRDIRDVPSEYLEWLAETNIQSVHSIEVELKRRELDDKQDLSMADRIIKAGYRELSKKYHPDAGGRHLDMVELNAAVQQLRDAI
jgi:hypothetical protein